jgi:hypothetical protein
MWRREKRLHPQNQPILTWVGAPRAREAMRCEGIKKRVSAQGCANRTTCAGACRLSIIACSPFTPGWGVRSFPTLSGARRSPVCARWKFWQWRLTSCMFLHTLTHFSIERTILSADEEVPRLLIISLFLSSQSRNRSRLSSWRVSQRKREH